VTGAFRGEKLFEGHEGWETRKKHVGDAKNPTKNKKTEAERHVGGQPEGGGRRTVTVQKMPGGGVQKKSKPGRTYLEGGT